jgi:UDP-N-acetylmuramyl pentapeptide synthase
MLELGPGAEEAHYELGLSLGGYGIGRLALVGPFAERVREGAIRGGLGKKDVGVFADPLEAFAFVRSRAQRGELILVKGSHSNGLTALARAFSGENDAL